MVILSLDLYLPNAEDFLIQRARKTGKSFYEEMQHREKEERRKREEAERAEAEAAR